MYTIRLTKEFDEWFESLRDRMTKTRLIKRLRKAEYFGNLGDVKSVGSGVFEMREHFAGGLRMYFIQQGDVLIIMLGGGDKSTQNADIAKAIALAKQFAEAQESGNE